MPLLARSSTRFFLDSWTNSAETWLGATGDVSVAGDHLGSWEPFDVAAVEALLSGTDVLWWLSGGEALDVFLGRSTRAHGDIDVSVRRSDWPSLRQYLLGRLEVKIAHKGVLSDVTDDPLHDEIHGFWTRDLRGGPWRLQINLEPVDGRNWVYRRDARITRPVDQVVLWRGTLPYVNPAVQLLFKAVDTRPQDEQDLAAVLPSLSDEERQWLAEAIRLSCPASPWATLDDS
jgi:hypothetical protein